VLATQGGNSTLKSVISNLFGSRAEKETILEIKNGTPDNETLNIYGLSDTKNDVHVYETIKIHGFVSSSAFGCGRSSADRQFVFVNGRPVDYDRVCFA
jgi:DNA mismatch repair protein PMS2